MMYAMADPKKPLVDEERQLSMLLAERVRTVMKERGINQGQLAAYAGLTIGSISNFLKGYRERTAFSTVYKIAKGLNIGLDQLSGISPLPVAPAPPASPDDRTAELERRFQVLLSVLTRTASRQEQVILRQLQSDASSPAESPGPSEPKRGRQPGGRKAS